jgi:hypothetical protein
MPPSSSGIAVERVLPGSGSESTSFAADILSTVRYSVTRWLRGSLPVMAAAALLLAPALRAQQPTAPLDSTKATLIRQLLEMSRAGSQILLGMQTTLETQRQASPEVPAIFWDTFMERAKASLPELIELLVPIYHRAFSTDQVRQLIAFYQSPIGQSLLAAQPTITREAMLAGQQWGTKIGTDVANELKNKGLIH